MKLLPKNKIAVPKAIHRDRPLPINATMELAISTAHRTIVGANEKIKTRANGSDLASRNPHAARVMRPVATFTRKTAHNRFGRLIWP